MKTIPMALVLAVSTEYARSREAMLKLMDQLLLELPQ